jgi:hypothetical protein
MVLNLPLCRTLAWWLLAAYTLMLCVSALAAALQPQTVNVVCSSMGVMKVVVGGDEGVPELKATMDCPLCAHATPALPAPSLAALVPFDDARAHIVQRLPEAVLLSRTAPPLPSRGPPVLI